MQVLRALPLGPERRKLGDAVTSIRSAVQLRNPEGSLSSAEVAQAHLPTEPRGRGPARSGFPLGSAGRPGSVPSAARSISRLWRSLPCLSACQRHFPRRARPDKALPLLGSGFQAWWRCYRHRAGEGRRRPAGPSHRRAESPRAGSVGVRRGTALGTRPRRGERRPASLSLHGGCPPTWPSGTPGAGRGAPGSS